jgi:hypothetical protein
LEKERRQKKRRMIKKLEELLDAGKIKNISRFTIESAYDDVEEEYNSVMDEMRRRESVEFYATCLKYGSSCIEYTSKLAPKEYIDLDGFGETINDKLGDYESTFEELYEKYKEHKVSPEIYLILQVVFTAAGVHMMNRASNILPGVKELVKESPELMKMFTDAAVKSMSNKDAGFSFANNLMKKGDPPVNTSYGPPPAPIETKSQVPPERPNRPDINQARGVMFKESGVDVQNGYGSTAPPVNISMNLPTYGGGEASKPRAEMKGPSIEMNHFLANLKPMKPQEKVATNDDSYVSIASLKEMQGAKLPTRSKRRNNKSDKNIVSLDI